VFALLVERCGLGAGTEVLEIGAGTGQATAPMLELGARVVAIEPGAALARELRARTAAHRPTVLETTFEDAPIAEASFDLVASATAFHWVDPVIGTTKAAFALRDGGWLAVWSTAFGDPERADPFHDAIQPLLRSHAPELLSVGLPRPGASDPCDDFEEAEEHVVRWEGRHDADQIRALFSTFSPWIALADDRREPLLDAVHALARGAFGGRVVRPYRTLVQLRRRRARSG
jgi:SAM-dependent methyltransferase